MTGVGSDNVRLRRWREARHPMPTDEEAAVLKKRAEGVLSFKINLPDLLPRAQFPSTELRSEWTDSDFLFASLFQWDFWKAVQLAVSDSDLPEPPGFPLTVLVRTKGTEDERKREFLRALARDVERHVSLSYPELLKGFPNQRIEGFCALRNKLDRLALSHIVAYRVWLGIQWAIKKLDSSVFVQHLVSGRKSFLARKVGKKKWKKDRLERTRGLFQTFREVWDIPADQHTTTPSPTDESRSGTQLDVWELPDHFLWYPESIRNVARAILAVPPLHLDDQAAEAVRDQALKLLKEEFSGATLDRYDPADARSIDPVAAAIVRALKLALEPEIASARKRRELIRDILDGVFPRGYRSPQNPLGSHLPDGRWSQRMISDYARIKRNPARKSKRESRARRKGTSRRS
jgi:hypothetical protein